MRKTCHAHVGIYAYMCGELGQIFLTYMFGEFGQNFLTNMRKITQYNKFKVTKYINNIQFSHTYITYINWGLNH